ncbi:hypothetical protein B0A55_03525 [Friedmanniomyces simplex]|uniref:AB hydrolase-1 domain-containing protein n=1 Tax=Friedmanniomyces simplex TaxID=329884 RepID=A0A4U0XHI9_9PEZI|nr:hypothetical protein B0A55_03525 [Friedmanniomyces simplex]
MDYAQPISATNNITIGLAMFRPQNPKAMDIRGTWSSNPLNVSLDIVGPLLGYYPAPNNRSEFDTYLATATTMWQSWANLSTPVGILDHVGTREVVQDYDGIRAALGYGKVHFLGASYGSYRAAQYASTFPERVGHFALDAVVPHGFSIEEQVKGDILAVNRGLDRADAYCQNNATCYWHHAGRGSVQKAWLDLLARAANGTLAACDTPANCTSFIPKWDLQATLSGLLQGQPDFPQLLELLAATYMGNGTALASNSPLTIDQVWGLPILCNDKPILDKSYSGFQKAAKAGKSVDRYNIYQSSWLGIELIGSVWPYPVPADKPSVLNATMLLVTADFDVSQATEKTTFLWDTQTPHAALVVRHGEDHVSFNEPTQASTRITKDFLRTGVLPLPEDNTFVRVYEPGQPRGPIADPYCVPTGFQAGDVDSS